MTLICPRHWRPHDIEDLEPNAWSAMHQAGSTCVVAGPGAGKTEYLAQRAVYLLETGICRAPYRILAISFKRDAALNLASRVRKRCPPELANRFISITFDTFTKGLVDRFLFSIPSAWRPTRPYEISFLSRRQAQGFLDLSLRSAPIHWQPEIAGLNTDIFESHNVGTYRLPTATSNPQSGIEFTIQNWWTAQLRSNPSTLTFVSLNRLAELLLRSNHHVLRALQLTYPFVFVDEFQDTTFAQYDFLLSAFSGADTAVTAVGDDKQRIMVWAGARPDAFRRFATDFNAISFPLIFNYRSSPDLVRIQYVVARALDPTVMPTKAKVKQQVDGDVAQVWNSITKDQEAKHLAQWLVNDMARRGRKPREYAILVKQRADDYETDLTPILMGQGLRLRNESRALGRTTLQDLLTDDFVRIAIAILRLGATPRAPDSWQLCSSVLLAIRATAFENDLAAARAEAELTAFILDLRHDMLNLPLNETNAIKFANRVIAFLDLAAIASTYIEYSSGDLLEIMAEAFKLHLVASAHFSTTWETCIDAFEGREQIPLMTVHKSKGLEYDTIIFIGLDDQAWWAHSPGNLEGLATFFVALSRAKQRAIFAFCQERGQRLRVAELFQLLRDAGVPELAM